MRLVFSDDYMLAEVLLEPNERPAFANVFALLAERGVTYGVLQDVLASIETHVGPARVAIARGLRPHEGQDARIEYAFRVERRDLRPVIGVDGRADHRNLGLIQNVQAGTVLARRTPPVMPQAGVTVLGHTVQPDFPKDRLLLAGPGAEVTPDGLAVVALVPGNPCLQGDRVLVRQELVIPGDVDLSTGNIRFEGDLVIWGDVQPQMEVQATGSVTISGNVDGARVEAGAEILVAGGVRRRAVLVAASDVHAQILENSQVRTKGMLRVRGDLVQADVEAYESLSVGGHLVGGVAKAGVTAETRVAGSRTGTPTSVAVVPPPFSGPTLAEVERELERVHQGLLQLTGKIRKAQGLLTEGRLPKAEVEALRKELELASLLNKRLEMLTAQRSELAAIARRVAVPPRFAVHETLYAEVALQLGQSVLRTAHEMPGCVLVEEDGAIRVQTDVRPMGEWA